MPGSPTTSWAVVMTADDHEGLLTEQVAHYRGHARDYLDGVRAVPGVSELEAALVAFRPSGDVLELARGPATWTPTLLRSASTVTAFDAAPEMLEIPRSRVDDDRVQFIHGDCSPGDRAAPTTRSSSGSGSRTCQCTASTASGRWSRTASFPVVTSSSWTIRPAHRENSWRARLRPRSCARRARASSTESSRCRTPSVRCRSGSTLLVGTSLSWPRQAACIGAAAVEFDHAQSIGATATSRDVPPSGHLPPPVQGAELSRRAQPRRRTLGLGGPARHGPQEP